MTFSAKSFAFSTARNGGPVKTPRTHVNAEYGDSDRRIISANPLEADNA
jgi:hypothetical protein